MKTLFKYIDFKKRPANLFNQDEIFQLYMDNLSYRKGLRLINKILHLDHEMIYTKAMLISLILKNNPKLHKINCRILRTAYKMQETARRKIMKVVNILNDTYFNHYDSSTFEEITQYYISVLQCRGIDIKNEGWELLVDCEEHGSKYYISIKKSYMDSFIQVGNSESPFNYISELMDYEDEPLNNILNELLGKRTSTFFEMTC